MDSTNGPQRSGLLLAALCAAGFGGCADAPPPGGEGGDASGTAASARGARGDGSVRPGVLVLLEDSLHLVRGRRVGLLTNHSAVVNSHGDVEGPAADGGIPRTRSTADLLWEHPEVELAALFGPEHGIRGTAEAGERVESGRDPETGLPVHSLYGETRRPPPGTLDDLDVLLFDIQDVGARYFTYVWSMALAMEAAGEAGIPFVVLDRINPVGGAHVQGNVLDPAFASFVGAYPVPMRHGMTPGELARLLVGEFGTEVDLRVIPAEGWRRGLWFDEAGLPWVAPSPNMPDLESATHYPGTCLFEGTNLSVGRGTDRAFQWVGAPWLDGSALAQRLEARGLAGVRFEAVRFTPEDPGDGKFHGTEVEGVRFVVRDRAVYDPTRAGVAAVVEARRLSGERWAWREAHFDRLAGTDRLRRGIEAGWDVDRLTETWPAQLEAFRSLREPYLLYPR